MGDPRSKRQGNDSLKSSTPLCLWPSFNVVLVKMKTLLLFFPERKAVSQNVIFHRPYDSSLQLRQTHTDVYQNVNLQNPYFLKKLLGRGWGWRDGKREPSHEPVLSPNVLREPKLEAGNFVLALPVCQGPIETNIINNNNNNNRPSYITNSRMLHISKKYSPPVASHDTPKWQHIMKYHGWLPQATRGLRSHEQRSSNWQS